jgi:sodium/potassium-transporting ATPase subunit alpha
MQIYLFIGLMMWPCAMAMWFYYMSEQGIGFHDLVFAYANWGSIGGTTQYTSDQLQNFVNVGGSIYYVTMIFMQYGSILSLRNRRVSIFQSNPFYGPRQNLAIFAGMATSAMVGVFFNYVPEFQSVFGTAVIPAKFWFIPMGFGAGILMMDELRKLVVRTYPNSFVAKCAW